MTDERAPAAVDTLAPIFARYVARNGAQEHIPQGEYNAAQWWLKIMENPGPRDYPEPIYNTHGDLVAWQTPYHDRLSHALRRFLEMTPDEQRTVVVLIESGIPYRGDTYRGYCDIAKHHQRMAENPAEYLRKAKAWFATGFKGIGSEPS